MADENTIINNHIKILTQVPIAIAFLDNNLRYVAHSSKWCTDYNLPYDNLNGMYHYDLFPDTNQEWKAKYQRALKGVEASCDQELFIGADGTEHWIKWTLKPWYNLYNEIAGIVKVSEDITSQLTLKRRTQLDHKILSKTNTKAKIGTWQFNNLDGSLYWSNITKEIHQLHHKIKIDAITAINFYKKGRSRTQFCEAFINSLINNDSYDLELELITAKGTSIWVRVLGQSDFKNGVCIRQYGTIEDISYRKRKESDVKIAGDKFQKLFKNSEIGVAIVDATTLEFKDVNPAFINLTKRSDSFLHTSSLEQIMDQHDFCIWFDNLQKLLNSKTDHIKQSIRFKAINGDAIYTQTISTVLEDQHGEPEHLMIQIIDDSNERDASAIQKAYIKKIKGKNERLLNFAYIVSHNLRSHSSNFKGLIDFYNNSDDDEVRSQIISMLGNSSDNLDRTIQDLNKVVLVNTKKLEFESINFKAFTEKILESFSLKLIQYDCEIQLDIDKNLELIAFPAYLESILSNLISNSIKYRDPDRPLLINISSIKTSGDLYEIRVTDNGLGIDLERHKSKVFSMYETFHDHKDSNGLGLFMTKNQVEAMGGQISITSKVGTGTTFLIEI